MKKIIAIALTLSLVFAVGAFSVSATDVSSSTGTTDVELVVSEAYIAVIPSAKIGLSETKKSDTLTVSASKANITTGKALKVAATATGGNLSGTNTSANKVAFETTGAKQTLTVGGTAASFTAKISDSVNFATLAADTYKGTVTFTFTIE